MHAPFAAQLPKPQLRCGSVLCGRVRTSRFALPSSPGVVARAKDSQKNDGVYFEYEAVDPNAAKELEVQQEQDGEQFGWAQRGRDTKKTTQQKFRAIDRKIFGTTSGDPARRGKGGRRPRPDGKALEDKRQDAAQAAAAAASNGPLLASFSPVETPAMRPRAVTRDDLLQRPHPAPPGQGPPAPARPPPSPAPLPAKADRAAAGAGPSTSGAGGSRGPPPAPAAGGAVAAGAGPAQGAAGGARRQRLLQRMKGSGGGAAQEAGPHAPGAAAPAAGGPPGAGARLPAPAAGMPGPPPAAAAPQRPRRASAGAAAAASGVSVAAAAAAAAAAAGLAPPPFDDAVGRELSSLAQQLPPALQLPPEARPARDLLASILSPSGDELRSVTSGDVEEMLARDQAATAEFRRWLRSASSAAQQAEAQAGRGQQQQAGGQQRGGQQAGGGAEGLEGELTEQEAADLEAALADLDLGDLGELGEVGSDAELAAALGLGGGGEGGEGEGEGDDPDGDGVVRAAMREVAELRRMMAAMAAEDEAEAREAAEAAPELSDEQVIESLRTRDPALYELLKDVPDFDRLGLDSELELDLGAPGAGLSAEELAELEAEAADGGEGEEQGAELEALLREMRGMGLMREGADGASDGEEEEDEEGDEGEDGLGLGDLLEAMDEDEVLDPRVRTRAQFALQSMFNQPADELSAKGSRGAGAGGEAQGGAQGAAAAAGGQAAAPLRGTTGMARDAVSADDEDGGAAPPPMLPKPKPRAR